jgi:glycosyltransferase involved in cell wall biosynthesis
MIQSEQKVGVIIPVYNRPKLVLDTLDSVARQTLLPGKLIIVDDGSTDDTARSVQAWIDKLESPLSASLVSAEKKGLGAARNKGVDILEGLQLLTFLDSDDRLPENFIERMTRRLIDKPEAVAVTCDRMYLNLKTMSEEFSDCSKVAHDPIDFIIRYGAGFTSSTMFRKEYVLTCGGYNESILKGEDADLMMRLALLGPWLHEPGEPTIYTIHSHIHDEEGHFGRKYSDANYSWAKLYDSFISSVNENHPKRKQWEKIIVRRWCRIGIKFMTQLKFKDARFCFGRAIYWKKYRMKVG